MTSKKLMIISRQPPYGTSRAREALDVALVAATYDQDVSLVFMDDGVFQLLRNQEPAAIAQKNLAANLSALPLYGVEKIYVHCESLALRQLAPEELMLSDIQLVDSQALRCILREQDQLLSF